MINTPVEQVSSERRFGWWLFLASPFAYLVATLFLLRSLLPNFTSYVAGQTDGWQATWNIWWVYHNVVETQRLSLFYTDFLYYPTGAALLFHTYNVPNGFFALPLTATVGPLVANNVLLFASFVATGWAAYALARTLGLGYFAAWLAGAVYTFANPTRWNFLGGGQTFYLAMQWMPLYILALVKLTSLPVDQPLRPRLRWLLAAAVFLVLTALADWQFFVYMGLFTIMFLIYLLLRERSWRDRLLATRDVVLAGLTAVAVLSPLLFVTVREATGNASIVRPLDQTLAHSWDLTAFVTPNAVSPLYGSLARSFDFVGNRYGDVPGISNAGYVAMGLALVGLVAYWRQTRFWAAVGLAFAIFALGPHLHVNDVDLNANGGIGLPYDILLKIPFFNIIRDPARFSLTAYLCIGLLAGWGWQAVAGWLSGRARRPQLTHWLLAGLAAVLLVGEFATVRIPNTTQPYSNFYAQLKADKADYGILEVPLADKFYADYSSGRQWWHGKRVLGGQTSRKPCYCFIMHTPVIRWFWELKPTDEDDITPALGDPAQYGPAVLAAFNLRYIVISKFALKPGQYEQAQAVVQRLMPGAQPLADDGTLTAYAVPQIRSDLLPIALLDDWGQLERRPLGKARWVSGAGATLAVVNASGQARQVQLTLQTQAFNKERTLRLWQGERLLGSATVKPQLQTVSLALTLAPGVTELRLDSPEPPISPQDLDPTSPDRRQLTYAVTSLSIK